MLFGLRNYLQTSKCALDIFISGLSCKSWPVYIEDVIGFSTDDLEHLKGVKEILKLLCDADVTINKKYANSSDTIPTTWGTKYYLES